MPDQALHRDQPPAAAPDNSLKTLLGFDYGQRRIGVAVGQDITATASALCTIHAGRDGPDWDAIDHLVGEWKPAALVVGLPVHADGSESESSSAAREFASQLATRYGLGVHFMDERLSSVAATGLLQQDEYQPQTGIDAIAARIILQDWLDTNLP